MSEKIRSGNELIAREGYWFIIPLAFISISCFFLDLVQSGAFFFLLALFCIWFFRNPERSIPETDKIDRAIVSPADGRIIKIEEIHESAVLNERCLKISIFMNIFDVHVNRIPFSGKIEDIQYKKGSFLSANLDKASDQNEKNLIVLKTSENKKIIFVQIAGLIARRIICWISKGMEVRQGDRFGLICFGSRVDMLIPVNTELNVKLGDRVRSGGTIIGWLL